MKVLLVAFTLSLSLSNVFAAQNDSTQCPYMRESNTRENPKMSLATTVKNSKSKKSKVKSL